MGNFLTVDGCFNHVTSHVKALGWLEKEEERKKESKKERKKERKKKKDKQF